MNRAEVAQLLNLAALVDNRTVTDEKCKMWHTILADVDYEDAVRAMREHYRVSSAWLMPSHVRDGVRGSQDRWGWLPAGVTPGDFHRLAGVFGEREARRKILENF